MYVLCNSSLFTIFCSCPAEALKAMEKVASHINDMQKIYEDYGAVFDQLVAEQAGQDKEVDSHLASRFLMTERRKHRRVSQDACSDHTVALSDFIPAKHRCIRSWSGVARVVYAVLCFVPGGVEGIYKLMGYLVHNQCMNIQSEY